MDPVTAISLAGAVVQFVSFAYKLVAKTREIHESASGQSENVATVEEIYTCLLRFSSQLQASSAEGPKLDLTESHGVARHVFAINELCRSCEKDCQKLLVMARQLQGKGGAGHRLQSFRAALKTLWKSSEIEELEERLHLTQTTLTLHICALTA